MDTVELSGIDISVEIVEKTEENWLWIIYGSDGSLINCGNEKSAQIAKDAIMKTLGTIVDDRIKAISTSKDQ